MVIVVGSFTFIVASSVASMEYALGSAIEMPQPV